MSSIDVNKDLSSLFLRQAWITPHAAAVEDEDASLTYAELERRTNRLANTLRCRGIGRDNLVGILLGRGVNYVVACLATLRAGGAFLVLELAYPPSQLSDVIEDAKPSVIITSQEHASHICLQAPLLLLDMCSMEQGEIVASNGVPRGLAETTDDDDIERLAFVSYTSGTTGRPKGIANPHRAAVRSYASRFGLSNLNPGDRVACNVFFVWEVLRPLIRGATVFVVPDEASYDPIALVDLLASRCITETLMTPTLLAAVLHRHERLDDRLPHLRTIWLNGEVVTVALAKRAILALPKARLLNCYSASETHEIAFGDIREMVNDDYTVCPVGPPVNPEHTYVLDSNGERVKPGATGELYVGGDLLARGYLNLPETTAKAFLPDPFTDTQGARMYRTGDSARILPSGVLEINGRIGAMIKLRGYSVQPRAVEATIVRFLPVQDCIVVANGDGLERRLTAYIVRSTAQSGAERLVIDESGHSPAARRVLLEHLAHYMIPSVWIELDNLPTHEVSGKVDFSLLPSHPAAPVRVEPTKEVKAEADIIAEMWAASLRLPASAITDSHDFFDLGGHSLSLSDLAGRLSKAFGFKVPLVRLAGNPTLGGHLKIIREERDGHIAGVQADLTSVLRNDCVLPADIQPSGPGFRRLKEASIVLLTGATGFLGAFLLRDILETTAARVVCLVRFNDPSPNNCPVGLARIRKNLTDLGIWKDSILDRVDVLPGNLSMGRLGLFPDTYNDLASRVQVIIHAAATVNLVYPYARLRSANVSGTTEILRLASRSGATVHHISTNGALPPSKVGWHEDTRVDLETATSRLVDGYGQTKWVSEQLVLEAARRGMPVHIYRPGTISGDSTTGSTNAYDLITALLIESLQIGYSPEIDDWSIEMTPVDFVSRAITTLASHFSKDNCVFHLGNASPNAAQTLFSHLGELGYATVPVRWEEWVDLWDKSRGSGRCSSDSFTSEILRAGMPSITFLKDITVLNDVITRPVLGAYGLKRPVIDKRLLGIYARDFYARGLLSSAPHLDTSPGSRVPSTDNLRPLQDRVAVVTGASSGIGAAVATALAREGAHVVLAARRCGRLEELRLQLAVYGVEVIAHPTDVTDASQVNTLMKMATEKLGPVDILVSCAGVMYFTMMANAQTHQWDRTVDVNCKGLLHCLAATVPAMLSRGSGHIVSVSSDAGRKVFAGLGVYSASKFFVEAAMQSLRLETAGSGLHVTSVQPGNTATELLSISTDSEALKKFGQPSGAKVLDAENVAEAVVYALRQPQHVAINEILIEPRDEPI